MNIIDNLIESFNTISEGLEKILSNEDYIFVNDKDGNIICTLYNSDKERNLLDEYLEDNQISKDDVSITVMDTLESEDLEELFKKHQIFS
ncbi:hypothetical protein [Vallitalea guaymasensis]|uniref:Uncharacterized protein n=1 Tax=Vallitalea guaymasensis TaxID=1185412 RepID=A0A8J8MBQ6_9FIRM|nr:hypothetical protein [Vallitalea guaymasensis]QUH30059.1 hypothetical protein HYG85_14510 [Vallitalea guaymasensis]